MTYRNGLRNGPNCKQSSTLGTLRPGHFRPGQKSRGETRGTLPCARRKGEGESAAPGAGRGALREEDGEEKNGANCSDFFPPLTLLFFPASLPLPFLSLPLLSLGRLAPAARHRARRRTATCAGLVPRAPWGAPHARATLLQPSPSPFLSLSQVQRGAQSGGTRALTRQTLGGGGEKMLFFVSVGVGGSGRAPKC